VRRILPGRAAELSGVYLEWLAKQQVLVLDGDLVNQPGRAATLTSQESRLATEILARFDRAGLEPPSPAELERTLDAKPQILEGVLRYLQERGRLVRVPGGLIIAASAIDDVRTKLIESDCETFSVGEFKELFGLTRKWAIPILEHLDSIGATRRQGDQRAILRQRA
jgi:selenocysteine-specific elongation factor